MSYRDPVESLRARRATLEAELAEARAAARGSEALAKRISRLERDLAQTDRVLLGEGSAAKRFLDTVHVAAPCTAKWDEMQGDDRVRHCSHCSKNVYNLSALPSAEAAALLREREGSMCIRFYRRADGTTITSDCPVGVRRRRRRRAAAGAVAAGAFAASAFSALFGGTAQPTSSPVMGSAAPPQVQLPPAPQPPPAVRRPTGKPPPAPHPVEEFETTMGLF
jgi:hypothetical protein